MTDAPARLATALSDRYRIERELGQGGMATVYLAHDVRHDRKVALKVLRPELAAILGAERFLKEIRTTANLQHPHILALHDSGEADGLVFYVMPYVEGESLRDRLTREHQLPVEDALRIAREVAGALDYAHRHGVVHRDIKPENILLHDGSAIVADFGIALAASRSEGSTRMTETGMSLGTPHYMAPEQAMGEREISPKADIYALGCVVYEMLAGEPPFTGPTAQAIIARVMTEQPRSLTIQRRTVPPHVESAIATALEKLPADRYASAAEFSAALQEGGRAVGRYGGTTATTSGGAPRTALPPYRHTALAAFTVAALVLVGLGWLGATLWQGSGPELPGLRVSIAMPSETPPVAVRLSPDGSTLAFISGLGDRLAIFTRKLDELEPQRVAGTEDAFSLAWSPDGQWLVFLVGTQARKVPANGGAPVAIPVQDGAGVTFIEWADNESFVGIVGGRLVRIAPNGTLTEIARADSARGEGPFTLDGVLPDGRLLARLWRSPPNGPVLLIDPRSGDRDTLVESDAAWSGYADGVVAWVLPDGTLYLSEFDPGSSRLSGPGRPAGVVLSVLGFPPAVSLARGALVYAPTMPRSLVRVYRNGTSTTLLGTDRNYHSPRLSPDGRRIALDFSDQQRDVWLFDVADSTLTRFGFDSSAHDPTWLPDGRGLLFAAARGPSIGMFQRRFDGAARAESVVIHGPQLTIHTVSRDGLTGVGVGINSSGEFDLFRVALDGSGRTEALLESRYNEGWPVLSPDGRWLAYASDESGRLEVYLRAWPGLGGKLQVSQQGGGEPVWSRDSRELFYRSSTAGEPRLMAAVVEVAGGLPRVRSRTELFDVANIEFATPHANYDVYPDGRSFLMVRQGRPGQRAEVVYLQNPLELLIR